MTISLVYNADGILTVEETGETIGCHWFAKCDRPARELTSHPVLGDLPTCDRCHEFVTGEKRENVR